MGILISIITTFTRLGCLFFFFKQKTAYEMRISDWSSDVCSSDLEARAALLHVVLAEGRQRRARHRHPADRGGQLPRAPVHAGSPAVRQHDRKSTRLNSSY